jgi:hypothetical protein
LDGFFGGGTYEIFFSTSAFFKAATSASTTSFGTVLFKKPFPSFL